MANPLTGDFEAVLQVSGATVNRLLASMHQNAGTNSKTPSFPHSIRMRVGDPHAIGGMRGTVVGQVSVPRIELIHGSTDHFWIEVGIRARYAMDPGTTPVPEYIHGTVRARYRIDAVDPNCFGWRNIAQDYIWVRVDGETVSFTGTAVDAIDNVSIVLGGGIDPATAQARVTRLITTLLKTTFEATPHKVSRRFQRGSMRSLHVGMNRSLVAMPFGLSGDPVPGNINSITQDLLDGRDFGIALSREAILARLEPALGAIRGLRLGTFRVISETEVLGFEVLKVDITWALSITNASAQWFGGSLPLIGVSAGFISLTISGQARTEKPIFNLGFDATQLLMMTFDAVQESFVLAPLGSASVTMNGTLSGLVEPYAKPRIQQEIAGQLKNALAQIGDALSMKGRQDELVKQLQTIDSLASARFDEAAYSPDGVIVRGSIGVSPRKLPIHDFEQLAQDGFNAWGSWIPGGRIDNFDWSWTWFNNAGQPGSEHKTDRFVLLRPRAKSQSKFGAAVGLREPLPGLDGSGKVCLDVRGVTVHPVTGEWVPVSTGRHCARFGIDIRMASTGVHRVFLTEWDPFPHDPGGPVEEIAVVEVGGRHPGAAAVNTLVVRVGERWHRETGEALREGLAACSRRDAGLRVLVLFRDGALKGAAARHVPELADLAASLEAQLIVNEDVRGSWSKALFMNDRHGEDDQIEWRLVTPTGGVTWVHTGRVEGRQLAEALDDYLLPSPGPTVAIAKPILTVGTRLSPGMLDINLDDFFTDLESPCPAPRFARLGVETVVAFVHKGSVASDSAIRKLMRTHGENDEHEDAIVAVIVDGATPQDVAELQRSLHERFTVLADPDGVIAGRVGVRAWPTTVSVNEAGVVTGVDVGADPAGRGPKSEQAS
jgi:hypothetical protein